MQPPAAPLSGSVCSSVASSAPSASAVFFQKLWPPAVQALTGQGQQSYWLHLPLQYERSSEELPSEDSAPSTSGRESRPPHADNYSLPVMHTPFSAHAGFGYDNIWDGSDDGFTPFPSNLPTAPGADSLPSHDLYRSSLHYLGVQDGGEKADSWRCLSQVCSSVQQPFQLLHGGPPFSARQKGLTAQHFSADLDNLCSFSFHAVGSSIFKAHCIARWR